MFVKRGENPERRHPSMKSEQHALDYLRTFLHLLRSQINPSYPVYFPSMRFCVFFRPEEDSLFSECVDDALFLEIQEVHIRHKDHRRAAFFLDRVIEIAVDRQFHRRFTVGAFSADRDRKQLVP